MFELLVFFCIQEEELVLKLLLGVKCASVD